MLNKSISGKLPEKITYCVPGSSEQVRNHHTRAVSRWLKQPKSIRNELFALNNNNKCAISWEFWTCDPHLKVVRVCPSNGCIASTAVKSRAQATKMLQ